MFNKLHTFRERQVLREGVFVEWSVTRIQPDAWRPHGVKYRVAYVAHGVCRLLFDNHTGKQDHFHKEGVEYAYIFRGVTQLRKDFEDELKKIEENQ